MAMTYATVCSGVEGCSLALDGMGWQPLFFSEIEPFPCAVLKAHYPNVPNLGDMSKISYDQQKGVITNGQRIVQFHGRLDLLAGGTPCQDFSVAGKRAGGAEGSGTRSSLMWQWLRLASELRPRVIFWENVVGCLSTNNGRDFSQFVAAVGELGYCVAWRVLDCQYTRVDKWPMAIPQRRRRVWLVGCADAEPSDLAEILFESRSVVGDSAPRRRTREEVARAAQDGNPLHARMVEGTIALEGNGQRPSHRGSGINEDGAQFTLNCIEQHGVAYETNPKGESRTQEAVVYRIDPLSSNSMKSANPNSGIHEVAVAQTLDTTTPTPVKNQGGDVIVEGKTFRAGSYGTYVEEGASGTLDCGHMAGIGNGTPCLVVEGVDGYNKTTTGDVAPTISGAASDIHHTHGVIVSNSNGGDVMPTINANEAKLGGDNQHIDGGGVRCP